MTKWLGIDGYKVLMQIVWSSRTVIYSTKYPTISANDNPKEIWEFPADKNGLPVMKPNISPIY